MIDKVSSLEVKYDASEVISTVERILRKQFRVYFSKGELERFLGEGVTEVDEKTMRDFARKIVNWMMDLRYEMEQRGVQAWPEISNPGGYQLIYATLCREFDFFTIPSSPAASQ